MNDLLDPPVTTGRKAVSLEERTIGGLHDFLMASVLRRCVVPGGRAIDLGAGSGALAVRLRELGWDVVAVEMDVQGFKADAPLVQADLNDAGFAGRLGENTFDLVTATEVIEHLENPIGFLRNVGRLLGPAGVAIVTTPNVDNAPARVRFLLSGKLRMMDDRGEPTHITPIFMDLFLRTYLPRAGLELVERTVYPPKGYLATRRRYSWAMRVLAGLLAGDALEGDIHIWCLRRADGSF